jgi:hypothetical protein
MGMDEDRRQVFEQFEQAFGTEFARALMRMVPPMDWEEVARNEDLLALRQDVFAMQADVGALKQDVFAMQADVGVLKQDVGVLKQDVGVLKQDVGVLKQDMGRTREEMTTLRVEFAGMRGQMVAFDDRLEGVKNELLAAFRGELLSAVTMQTRHIIFSLMAAFAVIAGLAITLARIA